MDAAAERYREALVYRPTDAELHASLGIVLARKGMLADARGELQKSLTINPAFQPAREALANVNAALQSHADYRQQHSRRMR